MRGLRTRVRIVWERVNPTSRCSHLIGRSVFLFGFVFLRFVRFSLSLFGFFVWFLCLVVFVWLFLFVCFHFVFVCFVWLSYFVFCSLYFVLFFLIVGLNGVVYWILMF